MTRTDDSVAVSSRAKRGTFPVASKVPRCARDDTGVGARGLMQRLYLQIYVTVLLVLAVFVGAAAIGWKLVEEDVPQHPGIAVELAAALLPEPTAPQAEQQKALEAV